MDRRMNRKINEYVEKIMDKWVGEQKYGRMSRQMDGYINKMMYKWMGG